MQVPGACPARAIGTDLAVARVTWGGDVAPRKKAARTRVKATGEASGEGPGPRVQAAPSDAERERLLAELRELNERLVLTSVREQELAERAEARTAEWNALLNSLTEGAIAVDTTGRLVLANPVAREMLELPRLRELTRAQDWERLDFRYADGRPMAHEDGPLARAIRGERFVGDEVLLVRRDGSVCRFAFNGSAVRDEAGTVTLAVLTFRDVTELRQLERTKEEYVAIISHDLRAPLTVILGRAQLLCRLPARPGLEPVIENASAILATARRMNAMIQDLLETSRLEAGRAVMHIQPLDLIALIHTTVQALVSPQDQSRIHIVSIGILPTVVGDRERIERVIMNLVSNALKFSPPDSPVEIRVSSRDREVVVSVTDHGVGVPPEDVPHLFEKYFRTAAGKERGGLGLGLYLSRLIVEAHGERIWATSEVGKGSTFSFSLPVK
jgi:signal transduction histidine kinase